MRRANAKRERRRSLAVQIHEQDPATRPASAAARLTDVVVFPTPPLLFITEMTTRFALALVAMTAPALRRVFAVFDLEANTAPLSRTNFFDILIFDA